MDRIHFKPICERDDWERARQWCADRKGPELRAGLATWWITRAGKPIGVTQRGTVPVIGLCLDEDAGKATETVRIIDGLRNWAQLANEDPLVLTHEDSAMAALHERMLAGAGEKTKAYWLRRED